MHIFVISVKSHFLFKLFLIKLFLDAVLETMTELVRCIISVMYIVAACLMQLAFPCAMTLMTQHQIRVIKQAYNGSSLTVADSRCMLGTAE